jgi:hypothetical protein
MGACFLIRLNRRIIALICAVALFWQFGDFLRSREGWVVLAIGRGRAALRLERRGPAGLVAGANYSILPKYILPMTKLFASPVLRFISIPR